MKNGRKGYEKRREERWLDAEREERRRRERDGWLITSFLCLPNPLLLGKGELLPPSDGKNENKVILCSPPLHN